MMERTGTTYALLVSVGSYRNAGIPDLPSAKNDLCLMKKALTAGLKLDADHIRILGDHAIVSARSFARAISEFSSMLSEEDRLIFYFSGHGNGSSLMFSDGSVRLQSILHYIEQLEAGGKIVILDCCSSGSAQISERRNPELEESIAAFVGKGTAVMASSAAGAKAWPGIDPVQGGLPGYDAGSGTQSDAHCSVYTAVVSHAMLSRHLIRKGRISLADLSEEIRYLMEIWNRKHPDRMQQPIFRENIGGTIFFDVEEYHPYIPETFTLETDEYYITSIKPLSTSAVKRLAVFIIPRKHVEKDYDTESEELARLTLDAVRTVKHARVYASQKSEEHFKGQAARAIWCYFGTDETDMVRNNYFAYTVWAEEELRKKYYRTDRYTRTTGGVNVWINRSYETVHALQRTGLAPEAILEEYRKLFLLLTADAGKFVRGLEEARNGTAAKQGLKSDDDRWADRVSALYLKLTDLDVPPAEWEGWARCVLETAGWIVDLAIWRKNLAGNEDERSSWLMEETIRRYYLSLNDLKEVKQPSVRSEALHLPGNNNR